MTPEFCCTGMLKGRESGAIVAHHEAAVLAIRLAADVTPLGLEPLLILRYCPSCGRPLDQAARAASEAAAAPAEVLAFPEWRPHPPGPSSYRIWGDS